MYFSCIQLAYGDWEYSDSEGGDRVYKLEDVGELVAKVTDFITSRTPSSETHEG